MARFCIECGAPLKEGAAFCTSCGAPVYEEETEPTCPHCGAPLDPGAAFCTECGARVDTTATMVMPAESPQDADGVRQAANLGSAANTTKKSVLPYAIGAAIAVVAVAAALVFFLDPFGWRAGADGGTAGGQETQQGSQAGASGSGDSAQSDDAGTSGSSADDQGATSADEDAATSGDVADEEPPATEPSPVQVPVVDHTTGVNPASEADDYYVLPESSTRVYSASELSGLSDWDLKVARNEIFARHGRGFNDDALQAYFNSKSWYRQLYTPEEYDALPDQLSETEHANVDVIKSLEPESNFH